MAGRDAEVAFKVFPQNPFAFRLCADSRPGDFLTDLRVKPRGKLWSGRPDDDRTVKGFGDDQIYVANYCLKTAYESAVPAPHLDTSERPPSGFLMGPLPRLLGGGIAPLDPGGWDQLSSRTVGRSVCAPAFAVAMVYAIARQTIDLWESHIGHEIVWYCAQAGRKQRRRRLEIVPLVATRGAGSNERHKNAVSGYGYIELGIAESDDEDLFPVHLPRRISATAPPPPRMVPYWLNADTVAHEIGHQILYASLGFGANAGAAPNWLWIGGRETGQAFRAFHESFGDMVAIMTAIQSDKLLDHVLAQSEGFLFQDTALTNIGEITSTRTIRDVHDSGPGEAMGAPGLLMSDEDIVRQYYALSESLTDTFFDILVGFAARLLDGLDQELVDSFERDVTEGRVAANAPAPIKNEVRRLYRERGPAPFRRAVRQASAALGGILGEFLKSADAVAFDPARFTVEELRSSLVRAGRRQIAAKPEAPLSRAGQTALECSIGRGFAHRRPVAR